MIGERRKTMALIQVTKENFESEVINSQIPVLADFNANWCGPCRMLKPTLEEIANQRTDVKVVSVNVDDEAELAEQFDVFSIPCVVLIKNGKEVNRTVGFRSKESILSLLGV